MSGVYEYVQVVTGLRRDEFLRPPNPGTFTLC